MLAGVWLALSLNENGNMQEPINELLEYDILKKLAVYILPLVCSLVL